MFVTSAVDILVHSVNHHANDFGRANVKVARSYLLDRYFSCVAGPSHKRARNACSRLTLVSRRQLSDPPRGERVSRDISEVSYACRPNASEFEALTTSSAAMVEPA